MIQLPGRELPVPQETIDEIAAGDRELNPHQRRADYRQGSLVVSYEVLHEVDPEAVAGKVRPTFPVPVSAEAMAGAQFLTQNDVELVG